MSDISTIYKISIIAFTLFYGVCGSGCPVLECWFVQEKPGHGGGLSAPMSQEKSLMFIRTEAYSEEIKAEVDITGLYQTGNASLILEESQVRHSGTYICTVYLPHLLAQVAVDLEIVEPPSLSILPSPLSLLVPGQVLSVQCEASGFAPHTLDLGWEFIGADGTSRSLGQGSVTGHRRASDGTFSQSSRLELDSAKLRLARGGEISCVAKHDGGTRRASAPLTVIGIGAPSIEDSMAMVAVALLLYGMIKFLSWTFSSADSGDSELNDKKEK